MNDPYFDLMNLLFSHDESRAAADPRRTGLPRVEPRPDHRHEPFPLTDIQHAYFIGRHRGLDLGGVASHYYLEFEGTALDIPRLAAALDQVVGHHDILRAVTEPGGGQRILAQIPPCRIATVDLRGRSATEQTAELVRVRADLACRVAPSDECPPLAVRAIWLADDRLRLHVSADLLFLDMRGLLRVIREWRTQYDDPAFAPAVPALSFRDYVLAEQALRAEPVGERARRYWLDRVDDLPAAPDLPLATAPEQVGTPTFAQRRAVLPRHRWAALTSAAERRGLTGDEVLLAAYCEVLRRWSRRQDFTVTLSRLDRLPLHSDVDGLVGNFLSPGLLAVTGGGAGTFEERAAALAERLREDSSHCLFSGIRVLRELTKRQGGGRAVGMPIVYSSTLGCDGDALAAFGELVHSASQTPQIWLENQVFERDGGVAVVWNSVVGLFPPGMVDAMFQAYQALLDRLVDDETWTRTVVVELPAAQADERDRANATAADIPPARLHELVAAAARRDPDAVAVIAEGAEVTYRELTEHAHRLARRLRECCGAEPNTVIAVSMRPGPELIAALLGILQAGTAYVSLDPDLPEQRIQALLRHCGVTAVVTQSALRKRLAWLPDVELVTLDEPATMACSADPVDSRQDIDDLAYVIFTSGSTGEPKGVMISHRSAANTVQDINRRFGVTRDDRVLALAPTGFDLSVYDVFGVLGAGGAVVVPSPEHTSDVAHWTELVDRHGVTIWNSVPAPMRLWIDSLADIAGPAPRGPRLALLSGDWIPTTLPGQIRERFPEMNVVSLGGATECSIWSIFYPIGDVPLQWPSIPYGKALANQTLHVYNQRLESCPTWVTGEIHIGGGGVAIGYWADIERTEQRFITHPVTGERLYRTGDLGRYLPGGDIEILGRDDFQVKINGYRVELGEIEAALSRQPGVRQALVAAPVYPHTGQRQLAAYLVVDEDDVADPAILRKSLADVLPSYMVPNHYITIDALPLTANGKINYSALPTPWNDGVETERRVAPRTDVEWRLLEIWSEQLGHSDLGVEDGFFDVGGDSLHAVGIIGHLRGAFGIDSAAEQHVIESLFTNATIAELVEVIMAIKADA